MNLVICSSFRLIDLVNEAGAEAAQKQSCGQEATLICSVWLPSTFLSMAVDEMAIRKCGLWFGFLVLGSFLPAVLVKFGVGKIYCVVASCLILSTDATIM